MAPSFVLIAQQEVPAGFGARRMATKGSKLKIFKNIALEFKKMHLLKPYHYPLKILRSPNFFNFIIL